MSKETLYYHNTSSIPEYSVLEHASVRTCPWYRALTVWVGGFKTLVEAIKHTEGGMPQLTAKVCPTVMDVLSNTVLVRTPSDLAITIFPDGSYSWLAPSGGMGITVSDHTAAEVSDSKGIGQGLFKGKLLLKINMPTVIKTRGGTPYTFLQPHFHNTLPYEVVQGGIPRPYSGGRGNPLNIIGLFNCPTEGSEVHIIKEGMVLAYIWGGWSSIKLVERDNIVEQARFTFLGSKPI